MPNPAVALRALTVVQLIPRLHAGGAERSTLTAKDLLGSTVELNGTELKLGAGDALPELKGKPVHAGQVSLAPASMTFFAFPKANNVSCQ